VSIPVIAAYDPAWAERGVGLCDQIRAALGPLARHVEHIGSTSIPGMAAKPIFDLQVSVTDLAQAQEAFDRPLSRLGFERRPFNRDHVPAGYDDPPEAWVKRYWSRRGHQDPDVNLHVRLAGSGNERLALLFRDWFRAHPEAVPGYASFKRSLAAAVGDIGVYTDVKDNVVDLIIAVAEPWAAGAAWTPHIS
jgi:GrpB-like predicted nucleotidyltransferase (UPF0157 family)